MPKVGNKEFAYTPAGEAAAEDFAMETGQDVIPSYDAGGRVERIQGYDEGGKVEGSQAIKNRTAQMRKDWQTHLKAEKELKEKYPEYKAPAEAKKPAKRKSLDPIKMKRTLKALTPVKPKKGKKTLTSRAKHLIKKLKPRGKGGAGGAGGDLPRRKRPGIK